MQKARKIRTIDRISNLDLLDTESKQKGCSLEQLNKIAGHCNKQEEAAGVVACKQQPASNCSLKPKLMNPCSPSVAFSLLTPFDQRSLGSSNRRSRCLECTFESAGETPLCIGSGRSTPTAPNDIHITIAARKKK